MHPDDHKKYREEIAFFMRRLYERGLTTALSGNISAKWDAGGYFITASQTDKYKLSPEDILLMSWKGQVVWGTGKASMEDGLHRAIYTIRPDAQAIIHAHPKAITLFAIQNKSIPTHYLSESYALLPSVKVAPYSLMGSEDLAEKTAKLAAKSDAVVMQNHGVICIGKSLLEAYEKLEVLENCAWIQLQLEGCTKPIPLSPEQKKDIDSLMGRS